MALPSPTVAAPRPARRTRGRLASGFTLVELVTVLLLVAVLAAVAVPRMGGMMGLPGAAWRDQLQAGLLQARSLAQGHRRLVCVAVATGELRLTQATANPASSCTAALNGPTGDARWAVDSQSLAVTVSPAGMLYFQPDGRVTSDGAGNTPVNVTITVSGEPNLSITGETGHVQ